MRNDFVQQAHERTDEQDQDVDAEQEAQQYGYPELEAHQRMDERLLDARRALDVRRAMTAPVDEAADAPQRQEPVENQVQKKLIRVGHCTARLYDAYPAHRARSELCPTPQLFDLLRLPVLRRRSIRGTCVAQASRRRRIRILPRARVPVRHLIAIRIDPHDPIAAVGSHLLAGVMRLPGQPAIPHGQTDAGVSHLLIPSDLKRLDRATRLRRPIDTRRAAIRSTRRYGLRGRVDGGRRERHTRVHFHPLQVSAIGSRSRNFERWQDHDLEGRSRGSET